MPEALTGLGIAGLVAAYALAMMFCLVQPIWAIVDCVDSERDRDAKILVSIAIFLTWGFGSLIYGLFFAASRSLRTFTVVAMTCLLGITVLSVGSCVSGVTTLARESAAEVERQRGEAVERAAAFAPAPVALDAVAPFQALFFAESGTGGGSTLRTNAALAEFTLAGPNRSAARDVRGGVRQVAYDADGPRTFALTQHDFGTISATTGEFIEIGVDPSFEFSWPKGLAWEPTSRRVVVATSHVYTRFFAYAPETATWEQLPAKLRDLPIAGLAWVPDEEQLYAFAVDSTAMELTHLRRFNLLGSSLGAIALDPAIPLAEGSDTERGQLHESSGQLVAMLPGYTAEDGQVSDRLFLIDPRTGAVSAP